MASRCKIPSTMILYHGTPYKFEKFENKLTFFAETWKFAFSYASDKSFESEMDADIRVFECKFHGTLFDVFDAGHRMMLYERLPSKVYVPSSGFLGMMGDYVEKDDLIGLMQGSFILEPMKVFIDANVGDIVKDPMVYDRKVIVVGKDSDYAYVVNLEWFRESVNDLITGHIGRGHKSWEEHELFGHFFDDYVEYVRTLHRKYAGESLMDKHFAASPQNDYGAERNIPSEVIREIIDEKKRVTRLFMDEMTEKEGYESKYNLKPMKKETQSTWTYFENKVVVGIIRDLGFDGYVAKERGVNTYAIFEPDKTIHECKMI